MNIFRISPSPGYIFFSLEDETPGHALGSTGTGACPNKREAHLQGEIKGDKLVRILPGSFAPIRQFLTFTLDTKYYVCCSYIFHDLY